MCRMWPLLQVLFSVSHPDWACKVSTPKSNSYPSLIAKKATVTASQ
jgi:hypothetical protein